MIKRYDISSYGYDGEDTTESWEEKHGCWCLWSDVEPLISELELSRQQIKNYEDLKVLKDIKIEALQKSYDNLVESYRTIFEENSKFNVLLEAAIAFTNISNDEYTDELYDKLVEAVKSIKDK